VTALSDKAIAQFAANAGFAGSDLTKAVAVALAESGGEPNAQHINTNGSVDRGLWQINSIHGIGGNLFDPATNAAAAMTVFKQQGWGAWTTFKSGAYLVFMGRATVATNGTTANGSNPGTPSATPAANTSSGIAGLQTVTMGGLWLRVGAFLLGAGLLVEGLLRATGASQTIVSVAKDAAKDAAVSAVM